MKVKVTRKLNRPVTEIPISSEFIKLDAFLKFAAICGTGGEAKMVIQEEMVSVNGETCTQRGKKLYPGDKVTFQGESYVIKAQ
jgi:ribosome-associated protein